MLTHCGGIRRCQFVACSKAYASANTFASPKRGPVICNPMGRPAREKPQGIEIVGSPSALNGRVFRIHNSPPGVGDSSRVASSIVNGGIAVVGVTNRSTEEKIEPTDRRTRSSSRRASTYAVALIVDACCNRPRTDGGDVPAAVEIRRRLG